MAKASIEEFGVRSSEFGLAKGSIDLEESTRAVGLLVGIGAALTTAEANVGAEGGGDDDEGGSDHYGRGEGGEGGEEGERE